ncbi:MAG: hypothetical protein GY807_08325 [Gammaproteobacteria bacterium]|nr:hypothetical protein [Gammaproteobacteria bacterium]
MSLRLIQRVIVLVATAGFSFVSLAEDDAPQLKHNPFKQPDLRAVADNSRDDDSLSDQVGSQLELRATLTLGNKSLANVGGKIIGIGEQVDGYRLLAVDEGVAVFAKNGTHIDLIVGDGPEGNRNE